jgi:hypothetical protein
MEPASGVEPARSTYKTLLLPKYTGMSYRMKMKKPNPFNLWDFITFGGAAILVTVAAILVQLTDQDFQAYALMWTTAAGFWFVYAMMVRTRWTWYRNVSFVTDQGLCVVFKDDCSYPQVEVEAEHTQMMEQWQQVLNRLGVKLEVPKAFRPNFFGDYAFVTFKKGPLTHVKYYKIKLAGYTIGRHCIVGVDKLASLHNTAFQHELGHVVYSTWKGFDNNNDEEHAFIKEHGLR